MKRRIYLALAVGLWFVGTCVVVVAAEQHIWYLLIAGLLLYVAAWRANVVLETAKQPEKKS